MPWGEGRGVSWAQAYLRDKYGILKPRQTLLRWADAGKVPGVRRDWGAGTERNARWLYTPKGLDILAENLERGRLPRAAHTDASDTAGATRPRDIMTIAELREFLAAHGVTRSYQSLSRRAREGQIGRKIGREYVISRDDARRLLARLTTEEDLKP